MALTAFAVSNLSFANGSEANMNMFYIRTLVDLAGVLILTVQHEQLREPPCTASWRSWTVFCTASTSSTAEQGEHPSASIANLVAFRRAQNHAPAQVLERGAHLSLYRHTKPN